MTATSSDGLNRFLSHLHRVKPTGDGEWIASCPAAGHGQGRGDVRPSLSINRGNGAGPLIKCFAGCPADAVLASVGMTWPDLLPPKETTRRKSSSGTSRIVATYDYTDADRTLLYQTVRYDPKNFKQRRPDPDRPGEWIWNLKETPRVLYHLPAVKKAIASGETVYIVEGEKDVDNLRAIGITATCNVGGAGKWTPEYSDALRGATVLVVPDADVPGRKHAAQVYDALRGVAKSVKILPLPGDGKDVSDWIAAGGTREELERLASSVDTITPFCGTVETTKPVIYANTPDLPTVTSSCWEALKMANDPPVYFRHGGFPCRLEQDELGNPVPVDLTPDRLRHELARVADWKTVRKGVEVDAKPPLDVMRDVLATPDPPLPPLVRIVSAPVFAPDGTLQTAPGYHEGGRVYYFPDGMKIPSVPASPSPEDVSAARGIILDLLVDFNFVGDADHAHAIALMLLPFVRDLIDGPTPNHLVEAPVPGSGKGLLTEIALYPALGKNVGTLSEVRNDEEMRKRITALLRNGSPSIVLDNVTALLNSGVWASALTATVWVDRVMGKSENLRVPVRTVWVTTGNNPTMTTEIARRSIRIRLDPKCDRPWQREGFRHPDLRGWAKENRGSLAWAALTMAQAWIAAGRPVPTLKPLGSYEEWTRVLGGILDHAGIGGFLGNTDEFYEQADTEGTTWRTFVDRWYGEHGDSTVGAKDLYSIAVDLFDLGNGTEKSQQVKFGKMLSKQRDRVVGDYRVQQAGTYQRVQRWRVSRQPK